jgi:bacteriorhodopsin
MSILNNTIKTSLFVQAITGLLGAYGLTIPVDEKDFVLKELLGLEMIVQIIEFMFYAFFLSVKNISEKRYYDWFLTTPVMLFTISLYFFYTNLDGRGGGATVSDKKQSNLFEFAKSNSKQIIGFVVLNFLMLLLGFLGELGIISKPIAFILGTLALCGSFGIIYTNYAKYSEQTRQIFWIMFTLWALYGGAFLLPELPKNISYTILDILAKNFFGIFLYYKISQKRV